MRTIAPSPSERQVFISFARGLSIFTIILYHFLQRARLPPPLAQASLLGGSGIYIFLFASSYGLYFSRATTWGSFYFKRFKRILLPYYIGVTLIVLINYFVGIYPNSWQAYLSHLLLYKMFCEQYISSYGLQFWFISTIIQFYLLWPLFLLASKHVSNSKLLLISFGISLLYSVLIVRLDLQHQRIWHSSVIQYTWVFALGLIAAKEQCLPRLLQLGGFRYGLFLIAGIVLALLISKLAGGGGSPFNDYFMFIAYFSANILLYLLGQKLPFIIRFVLWIESFSYSLYIVHLFILFLYLKVLSEARLNLYEVPAVTALCIGVALLFDRLIQLVTNARLGRPRPVLGV
ncbi:acyltransferase family protein [uncultured Hymenobacter sp.]|uniref:acyltransferase family protein n=1 Tax=uncultured Hymenobacter sp. TaxID=170016 RepID=UPI0035CA5062